MKYFFLLLFFLPFGLKAQVINKTDSNRVKPADTLVIDSGERDSLKIFKPTIHDYQYQTQFSEKKDYDTTFDIHKSYQYTQYNNQDNFGRIQFANIGAGFQPLVFEFNPEQNLALLPTNKAFGLIRVQDVRYYYVKTPTTTFLYHTAMRNGGALQTTYTQNIGKYFNFSLGYMGLRSEGLYQNSLTSNNNTFFSAHYHSKNGKYHAFAHYIHQNVNAEEYGGIADLSLFTGGDDRFDNRENLEVNLPSSDSRFSYRRYYFSQEFSPFNPEKVPFKIRHTIFHQGNKYFFTQSTLEPYYYTDETDLISGMPISAKKYSNNLSNTVSLLFDNKNFKLEAGVRHQNLEFGTNNILLDNNPYQPRTYNENRFGAVGRLQILVWDKFNLNSFAEFSNGSAFGNYLRLENQASFEPFEDYVANVFVNFQSVAPSFNYLLNHSVYQQFNYDFTGFTNQNVLEAGANIDLKIFKTNLFAKYFRIDNYAYFDASAMPMQSTGSVNISQIGGDATFSYNKFHLNTKVLFQSAINNTELFPMPNFVGRASLYWQSKAFKKAAEIQTGVRGYYFTKFASRDYMPVLNEYILPNSSAYSIGGQPIVDLFFNLRVKRMFFYIEGQQMTTLLTQNKSYTAPYYPLYDFRLNIGIVWYLFH